MGGTFRQEYSSHKRKSWVQVLLAIFDVQALRYLTFKQPAFCARMLLPSKNYIISLTFCNIFCINNGGTAFPICLNFSSKFPSGLNSLGKV